MNSGGFGRCQGSRGLADGAHAMFVPVSFECAVCTLALASPSNRSDPVHSFIAFSVQFGSIVADETCVGRRASRARSHPVASFVPTCPVALALSPPHRFSFILLQLQGPDRPGGPSGVADELAGQLCCSPNWWLQSNHDPGLFCLQDVHVL